MKAIEFTTELTDSGTLSLPREVVEQLPKAGRARVIILADALSGDEEWRAAAYEQFLRDDSSEDAIYETCR